MQLAEKITALHSALHKADIPHAFGGALALAWCTRRARGTIDIDINIFVPAADAESVWASLPSAVTITEKNRDEVAADGQTRLWWGSTPIDAFLNTTPFHEAVAQRARVERFEGCDVPFLACADLAVFKAFFNRTKDWADLEEMHADGTLDHASVAGVLATYLGPEDERIARLLSIRS